MQILDDRAAEVLVGGRFSSSSLRQSFNFDITVNNVITVVPQVSTGVAVAAFGGEAGVFLASFADINIDLD
jgi:hypothetical protein